MMLALCATHLALCATVHLRGQMPVLRHLPQVDGRGRTSTVQLAFYPVSGAKPKNPVHAALKKKSGATTVSLAIASPTGDSVVASGIDSGEVEGAGRRTKELSADARLYRLSAELRGGRDGPVASALWTRSVDVLTILVSEQATAMGDFPGPCPIVFTGDASEMDAAVSAGAAGVLLSAAELELGKSLSQEAEVIWDVSSAEEIATVVADEAAPKAAFLLPADDAPALAAQLPTGAVAIAAVEAMLPDDGEVVQARELVSAGCKSILVRGACVGDAEDLPYAKFVVKELTSKRSSTFAIDGHTGAVNGHFGGARASHASPKDGWIRRG